MVNFKRKSLIMNGGLIESEEKFRNIFENANDAMLYMDRFGKIIEANRKAAEVFGGEKKDLIGKNFARVGIFSPREILNLLRALTKRIVTGKSGFINNLHIKNKKGREIDLDCSSSLVKIGKKVIGIMVIARDITERKKTEKALLESEKKYRQLVELAQEGIWVIDNKAHTKFVNPRMAEMLGYSIKEMQGRHLFSFIDKEWLRTAKINLKRRERGIMERHDFEFLRKDGSKIYTSLETTPLVDEKGCYVGALALVADITDRKLAEEKLRQKEEYFRSIIENISDVIAIMDAKGKIIYESPSIKQVLGYDPEELIGKDMSVLLWPDELIEIKKAFSEVIKKPDTLLSLEIGVRHKDGSRRIIEAVGRNLLHNTAVNGIIANYHDITEREKMEEAIKESKKMLENIIASSPDAITVSDLKGNIINCNQATLDLHDFSSKEELIGKDSFILISPKDRRRALENMKRVFQEGALRDIEYALLTKDGRSFPAELSASVIKNNLGKPIGFIAITKDISERKKIDRAKSEFVSLASHQLRTPLTIMSWYSEMLLGGRIGKITDQQNNYLNEIYKANQNLIALVNLLLNISRIELGTFSINPKPTNIINIAETVINELSPLIQKRGLKISRNYYRGIPKINADKNIMHIIFQNLLSNAIKYNVYRGKIEILIKKQEPDLLIEITDTGYGIPRKQQPQIFTKFFRAENIKEKDPDGNGLGLYIVKSVLEQAGGKIWFKSRENKGSTFYVKLPLIGMKNKRGTKELII